MTKVVDIRGRTMNSAVLLHLVNVEQMWPLHILFPICVRSLGEVLFVKGISKQKKVRGQTTCKYIHARNLEEREEVTFDKGQAVGLTDKIVSKLTNFIRKIARNPRFINLMYTSWHAVPKDIKKRMSEDINSKFLIPVEGMKWVMTGLRDAWSIVEDMLAKRPDDIPEVTFRQLIEYWKHPTVKAELHNRQNSRKTTDDAFRAVFGKEQPGRLSQLLEKNPGLNVQDIPGVVGSYLVSPIDASSAQAVRCQNIPHSSGSTHDSILQNVFCWFLKTFLSLSLLY
ncbi:hypothetical protein KY285_024004 [Solanum tuberosum]|nr:hypothetical protein KY289_024362 [Solanum tuberosum]KAH0676203.1 hypothetical protein KY285_024004 [Solanum tuberosum]